MILVNSFGGCATTVLIEQISASEGVLVFDGTNGSCKKYKHILAPPRAMLPGPHPSGTQIKIQKALYIYCDPIDAIKTFYRKREFGNNGEDKIPDWVTGHCKNIGGDFFLLNPQWNIDDYAKQGRDLLKLEEHWFNWSKGLLEYDIMYVKYENLWYHLDKIANFLGLPKSFIDGFPKRRPRNEMKISEETLKLLSETYEDLVDEIKSQPDIRFRTRGGKCHL